MAASAVGTTGPIARPGSWSQTGSAAMQGVANRSNESGKALIILRFPFFDHSNHVAHFPEAGVHASGLSGRHAMRAADFHEVVVHRVEGKSVDVVLNLL